MRIHKKFIIATLALIIISSLAIAYPVTEKEPTSASAPLDILSAQPDRIFLPITGTFQNKYMFSIATSSTTLTIIDLETWDTYTTQPDAFLSAVSDVTLLTDGTTLIVGLSSGNIATLELDDEDTFTNTEATTDTDSDDDTDEDDAEEEAEATDSRQTDSSENMTSAGITFLVSDPVDDIIYTVNSTGYYFQYNIDNSNYSEVYLENTSATDDDDDETTTAAYYTPTDMVYADSSAGDKVLISTSTGDIIVITPGETSYTVYTLSSTATSFSTETPNFADIALTPDNDYLYIIDSDNDLIWVFSLLSNAFIDQISSDTSLDPINVDDDYNKSFTNIFVYEDADGDVVAYASGESGISLIDASDPGTAAATKVLDGDTTDSVTDEDPIPLSGTPGLMAATSNDVEYVFSVNANAEISVLTDNPWISISSISTTSVNATDSTFTLTFQSDIAGDYTIRANSDATGATGTELIASTAFTDVDTDITTASIDINSFERATFIEGTNKIFALVTDANSLTGHSAITLTVDRPPEATTITGVSFGNQKAYVNFTPSPDEDIDYYVLYAEPAESQTSPSCPGTLTFTSGNIIKTTYYHTNCSTTACNGEATGLTNDVTYCVAVKVVDFSVQASPIASYTVPVTPEQTVGPAGFFGETSCSLSLDTNQTPLHNYSWLLFFLPFLFFLAPRALCLVPRNRKNTRKAFFLTVLLTSLSLLLVTQNAQAEERTPQNWTLEAKIYHWIPMDTQVRNFMGICCHFGGEVEFGYLLKDRYNFTISAGMGFENGNSVGIRTGGASGDNYILLLFPIRFDFIYRFDFKSEQLFLPYIRAGGDVVVFYEGSAGSTITNYKFGFHGGIGVGILLDRIEQLGHNLEEVIGVNDVYLTIEARYAYLNSFSSTGLDLTGFYPYIGVLFEF